jgi:hypothetical protein
VPTALKNNPRMPRFLNISLKKYIFPLANEKILSDDKIIARLEILEKAARRIAYVVIADRIRRNEKLPDADTSFDEIKSHKIVQMLKLKEYAKNMLEILNSLTLPAPICAVTDAITTLYRTPIGTVSSKLIKESLASRLTCLIAALDKHTPAKIILTKNKKGKAPFRLDMIYALTDAWCDLTRKPPEKLKRNRITGKLYGEFYDFMQNGLKLFGRSINTEEALKDARKYYMEKLVRSSHQ